MTLLLGKAPSEIRYTDLKRLIVEGEQWREGRFWDFKTSWPTRQPPGGKDQRRELLADISSFANADGGVLVVGVGATNGVPTTLPGLQSAEIDAIMLRLQALAREHLDPPMTRLLPHVVEGPAGTAFLVVEIPRSLLAPHAVWLDRDGRFWKRNTGGKYQVDVTELRQMFLEADRWLDQATSLRTSRVAAIAAGRYATYAFPSGWSAITLHSVPLGRNRTRLDLDAIAPKWHTHFSPDTESFDWLYRYTVEGGLVFANDGSERAALVHCLRTGTVEQCIALHRRYIVPDRPGVIDACRLQSDIGSWFEAILHWQRAAGIEPPIALFLSLLSVNGLSLVAKHRWALGEPSPSFVDRDIELPEVIVNDHGTSEWSRAISELTTLLWQTAGLPKSPCP